MTEYEVDSELLAEFIDETRETLAPIDQLILDMEQNSDNSETINAIFRPIHSLKGSASFFGLHKTQKLSHAMEDLMSVFRKGERTPAQEDISLLLQGLDILRSMTDNFAEHRDEKVEEKILNNLISELRKRIQGKTVDISRNLKNIHDKLKDIKDKTDARLKDDLDSLLEDIGNLLNSVKPKTDTKKPEVLERLGKLLEAASESDPSEDEQKQIRESLELLKELTDSKEAIDLINAALDEFDTFTNALGYDPLLHELLTEKYSKFEEMSWLEEEKIAQKSADNEQNPPSERRETEQNKLNIQEKSKKAAPEQTIEKTMRISEAKLDSFLQYVGELVVIEEMFEYQKKQILAEIKNKTLTRNFTQTLKSFGELSARLREGILSIRKVPVNRLLQKSSRLVHDVALRVKKQVKVVLEGEDELIDKSYMELLDAPFVHILRNAVDHGIETPDIRKQKGKPEHGTVKIQVINTGEEILIRISDDGAGINREKVRKKGVALGLISDNDVPNDKMLTELIFSSGFSTAEKVSDISGRGVGMDVVKKNIESIGGSIKVTTKENEGSIFEICLPENISTQIEDGFIVLTGEQRFVLPLQSVKNTFKTTHDNVHSIHGHPVIVHQNITLPIIDIAKILRINEPDSTFFYIVVVEAANKLYALKTDAIIGMRKIVVKPFASLNEHSALYRGAAIMGDGDLVLSLDIEELIKYFIGYRSLTNTEK